MIPKIGTRFWESKLNRVSSSQQWINSVVYKPTHFHHQTSCSIGYIYYLKHIHFLQNIIFFKRTIYRMHCPFEWPGCQAQSLCKEASRYFNSTVFNELWAQYFHHYRYRFVFSKWLWLVKNNNNTIRYRYPPVRNRILFFHLWRLLFNVFTFVIVFFFMV